MILISLIWYKNEMRNKKRKIDKLENRTVRSRKKEHMFFSLKIRRIIIKTDMKNTNMKKAGEKPKR